MPPASKWAPCAVFAIFLLLYGLTCARTVQGGDAGEYMTIAALGGVVHPPGYPLHTMLVRLAWFLIPFGSAAFRASFVSAVLGAASLALLTSSVRQISGSSIAGVVAAGALGLSPVFWRYATVAEVFMGGALTAMLVVRLAVAITSGWQGPWVQLLLGLAVATGIANHHSVVLLAPVAIWAFIKAYRRPMRFGAILGGCAACLVGLSGGFLLYLTLMPQGGAWRWGETDHLQGLLHHFLRADYGTFRLALADDPTPWWAHPVTYLQTLPSSFLGVFAILAVVGFVVALRAGPWRGFWVALSATWILAGPVFLSRFNVACDRAGLVVASRFYILPDTILATFIGCGAASIASVLRDRAVFVGRVALASLLLLEGILHLDRASHADWTPMEDYLRNTLSVVEPGALIIGDSDDFFFGMLYMQEVEGVRPDVVYISPTMLSYPWYRAWLSTRHPEFEPASLDRFHPIPELIQGSLPNRPVYMAFGAAGREGLQGRLPPLVPEAGVLMRALRTDEPLPPPSVIAIRMDEAMEGFTFRTREMTWSQWSERWEGWAFEQYTDAWISVANAYGFVEGGETGRAACLERAARFLPWKTPGS